MPSPSTSLATLRPDLGGSLEEFSLEADRLGFVGLKVLPVIESVLQGGTYGKIPLEELLKEPELQRNSRGGYSRSKFKFEDASFATREWGHETPVDERNARMYRNYFDAEMISARICRDIVLRAAEKRVADAVYNTTTWSGPTLTTGITNEWDDYANAVPIDDINAARNKVYALTGTWPNKLLINVIQMRHLRRCEQVVDSIASSGAGQSTVQRKVTAAMLAEVLDLDEVIVAGGSRNIANEGQASSISQIWSSEYAMLFRAANTNDITEACLGHTIHWGEDGSQIGGLMESYYVEENRSDIIRCRHEVQELIKYKEMGHLLSNVLTL